MDSAYYDLIRCCIDCASFANIIARNSNYNQEIMVRTDVYIVSACKEAFRLRQCLDELLKVQAVSLRKSDDLCDTRQ